MQKGINNYFEINSNLIYDWMFVTQEAKKWYNILKGTTILSYICENVREGLGANVIHKFAAKPNGFM